MFATPPPPPVQQQQIRQQYASCHLYRLVARNLTSCANLQLERPTRNVITFGWQPEFDACSIGVFLPRAGVGMTEGAKAAIKSVLYFRSVPVTFYIVISSVNTEVEAYFMQWRFPFVRLVLCDMGDVATRLNPETARRGHGGVHPYFVVSYMVAHIWALPGERVMITTASDQVHMVDVAEVYEQFLVLSASVGTPTEKWYGAIRGHYLDMWRSQQRSLGPHVQGMANAQVIHVSAIWANEPAYMLALRSSIAALQPDHGYGDMDIMSAMQSLYPKRMVTLGCFSMVDTAMLFHKERGMFCESVPRSVHMNVAGAFTGGVSEDVRFISLVIETMRAVPERMLATMCPYQMSQSGDRWRWAPHPETWHAVGELHRRKDGRNSAACRACLGN